MNQSSISVALIRPLIEAAGNQEFNPETDSQHFLESRLSKLLKDPDARISTQDADLLISKIVSNSKRSSLCVFSAEKQPLKVATNFNIYFFVLIRFAKHFTT
jgi:hypothetical protein